MCDDTVGCMGSFIYPILSFTRNIMLMLYIVVAVLC